MSNFPDSSICRVSSTRAARRVPAAQIESIVLDGAAYKAEPASFDLAVCLGASWTFGGHRQTLRALATAVKPGGKVLIGDPFWMHEPDPEYLASERVRLDEFDTHEANVEAGGEAGAGTGVPALPHAAVGFQENRPAWLHGLLRDVRRGTRAHAAVHAP